MNATLKRGLERALSSVPIGRLAGHRTRGKYLILAYHGIVPHGEEPTGERSLFVSQKDFAAQLDALAEMADIVALGDLYHPSGRRPRVAITFDDAYRGAVNEGVAELVKRYLAATIFAAPGRLNDHVFWWDALAAGAQTLDADVRNHALNSLAGSDERVRAWAKKIRLPCLDRLPAYARSATRGELALALANPGITVGSHSWSHANLSALGSEAIADELQRSGDWLKETFPDRAIPWIAYPYGLDSEETLRVAARAGYEGGLRVGGGWHDRFGTHPLGRPRLNVPATLSLPGFRARLLGALKT